MRNELRSCLATLAAETRGAEIAEAAAVLPLMFMMLLGIFWFGQAFSIYGAITRAAQEGARAGAVPYCATCAVANSPVANANNAVTAALIASKLDPLQARNPSPPPALVHCTSGANVPCPSGGNFCVQTPVQFLDISSGAHGFCGTSVSFQYPFQFWLPFTSVNKQRIWISASARVRKETR
jgi:Flp pilus assembly protein TadG